MTHKHLFLCHVSWEVQEYGGGGGIHYKCVCWIMYSKWKSTKTTFPILLFNFRCYLFPFTRTIVMPNHRLQTRFGSVVFFLCCRQSINLAGKTADSKWGYWLQISYILWIWILFSRLSSCLKISIIDFRCPTSFGLNFVQQVKQLTENEHYCVQISHILWLWILFSRFNSWLRMNIIDCRYPTSFGFEFCSAG